MTATAVAQQSVTDSYRKKQDKAYKLITSEPVKARYEIELLLKDRGKIPDSIYAMNWNLLGIYYGVSNMLDSAHYALDKSISLLPDGHSRKMALINNKAIIYRKQKRFEEGLVLLEKAEKDAIKFNDSLMLGTVIGERASYYSAQSFFGEAATQLLKSIQILEKYSKVNRVNLFKEKQKLANLYSKMSDYSESEKLYKEILPFFKSQKELDTYFISLINLGDVYLHQKRYDDADKAFAEGHAGLLTFPNRELQIHALERIAHLNMLKGRSVQSINQYQEVYTVGTDIGSPRLLYYISEYADALLKHHRNEELQRLMKDILQMQQLDELKRLASIEEHMTFCNTMAEAFSALGRTDESIPYFRSALLLKDSFSLQQELQKARIVQAKYKSELKDKENQILTQQNELQRMIIIIVVILLMLFSSFLVWKWYINQARLRIKTIHVEALAKEKGLLKQKLAAEQELVKLKEQVINGHKNDLMVKSIENLRLNKQLNDLLTRMEENAKRQPDNDLNKTQIELEHWDDIIMKFKQLNPEFIQKVQMHGDSLSKGDLEFCSMARMNLSNKDIARLLNISLESVRTKKYRLMKKLNLPETTDFYNWIISL